MSLPSKLRFIPAASAAALVCLAGSAQAISFDCDSSAAHPDTFTQLNSQLYVLGSESRLNLCQTTPKTLSASVATAQGHSHGAITTTTDFGLQTVHAALDAKNIVGQLGGGAAYQLVARDVDFITASTDTTFRVTSRLVYAGSRVVSNPGQDRNHATGNLQISGPGIGFNEAVIAGPTGSGSQEVITDVLHLSAGQTTRLSSYLYADVYVDPNGIFDEAPGWALMDAQFITRITVVSGGALTASSGHDYSAAAVPEPANWALMAGGLALLGGMGLAGRRKQR